MKENNSMTDWIKENLFSVINLLLIVATFSYNYGITTSKIGVMEAKIETVDTTVSDIQLHGTSARPQYEARLVALEKKTDDLAVLKQIVTTQSENIRQLTETVRADHDILVRFTMPQIK